jgi:hydroxypyruvate isomerase
MQRFDMPQSTSSRRAWMKASAGIAGAMAVSASRLSIAAESLRGNINHSVVEWCFAECWGLEETCRKAKSLGCKSVELVQPENWPTLKKHGLKCAISPSHLYVQGMNNPKYQPMCIEMLHERIDQSVEAGVPTVITFTGYAEDSGPPADGQNPDLTKLPPNRPAIDPVEGATNCVAGFKKIVGYAEKKKINLAIEILNTRATDHPMTGHPGYQGDHVDYCMDIVRRVGSPRLGLLFDIYHVQIMDGDLVRRIHQCKDSIFHVHTAGNPGRHELDPSQEINYPAVMKALVDVGYKGFVGHEFMPTRDPLAGLTQAIQVCDV